MSDQRLQELATLNEISKIVNSTLDLDVVLKAVVHLTKTRMGVGACSIYLVDDGQLVLKATDGLNLECVNRVRLALGQGITGWTASTGISRAVMNVGAHERFCHIPELGEEDYSTLLSVPLISRGTIIGVINVQTRELREYTEQEKGFLSSIAGHIAGAIRNAQLYVDATRTLYELTTLTEVSKVITSTLDLSELLNRVAAIGAHMMNARGAFLRIEEAGELMLVAHFGLEGQPYQELLTEFEEQFARDVHQEGRARARTVTLGSDNGAFTALCVPFSVRDQVKGAMTAFAATSERSEFSLADRRLMTTLVSQAGIAIQNARLYAMSQQAQDELRRAHNLLVQQEKLAALGQMAAGVAHELRNPLVTIGGFARRLEHVSLDAGRIQQYSSRITREVGRLEKIIEDILNYASPASLCSDRVDLHHLFADLDLENNPIRLAGNVQYVVDVSDDHRWVMGDEDSLRRVFLNLIENAFQSVPPGGTVSIRTHERADGRINVEVRDDGFGMPPEVIPKIFDPFYTTRADGTGLGLAIARNVMSQHGGAIQVESEPGKGSTFRVDLAPADNGRDADRE